MRRLLLLLAASATLAGCTFDLEGAACSTPGETDQCPTGQKCGLDGKCSERAARPDCNFCTIDALSCGVQGVGNCIALDNTCNTIEVMDDCPGDGLVCGLKSGAPACQCPELAVDAKVITVRSDGSPVGSDPFPTGVSTPSQCSFKTIGAGMAEATGRIAQAPLTVSVEATGVGTNTFQPPGTVTIPKGVTLKANPPDPALFVLEINGSGQDLVRLEGGAGLEGFTIRPFGATPGDAVEVVCAAPDISAATLSDVVLDGSDHVTRGVVVASDCVLQATDLVVKGATAEGVLIDTGSENLSTIMRGEISGNGGTGVAVRAGRATLAGDLTSYLDVHDNGVYGVLLTSDSGTPRSVQVSLERSRIHDNEETGLVVLDAARVATSSVALIGNRIYKNRGASNLSDYGPTPRRAGGVLLAGTPPAGGFSFQSNMTCSNFDDEVGVWSASGWVLDGTACATTSNLFVGTTGYLIFSVGAGTTAYTNFWATGANPPSTLLANVAYTSAPLPYCTPAPEVPAECN